MLRTTVLSVVAAIALPLVLSASAMAAPDSTAKLPKEAVAAGISAGKPQGFVGLLGNWVWLGGLVA